MRAIVDMRRLNPNEEFCRSRIIHRIIPERAQRSHIICEFPSINIDSGIIIPSKGNYGSIRRGAFVDMDFFQKSLIFVSLDIDIPEIYARASDQTSVFVRRFPLTKSNIAIVDKKELHRSFKDSSRTLLFVGLHPASRW